MIDLYNRALSRVQFLFQFEFVIVMKNREQILTVVGSIIIQRDFYKNRNEFLARIVRNCRVIGYDIVNKIYLNTSNIWRIRLVTKHCGPVCLDFCRICCPRYRALESTFLFPSLLRFLRSRKIERESSLLQSRGVRNLKTETPVHCHRVCDD